MKRAIIFLTVCHWVGLGFAQSPRSIDHAIRILEKNCSDSLKAEIRITDADKLPDLFYPWSGENETLMDFTSNEKELRYQKYYAKRGIHYKRNIEVITLIAFKRYLNGIPINHDSLVNYYRKVDEKWEYEDENRYTVDSIRGMYIPKDILDCFTQFDSFWNDSTKTDIKSMSEMDFATASHFGIGLWIRNNWQLWGGSRLSEYFHDKDVFHPDSMSWIILVSYHRYLNGEDIRLEEQLDERKR